MVKVQTGQAVVLGALASVVLAGWVPAAPVSPRPPAAASALVAADLEPAPDPRPWTQKVVPSLLARALSEGGELACMVTLRESSALAREGAADPGSPALIQWIAITGDVLEREYSRFGVRVAARYSHLPVLSMTVPAAFLPALAADPRVEGITPIRRARAMRTEGKALMNVPAVAAQGITGAGVGVAVLDTGVDYTHPELSPAGTKVIKLLDTISNDDDPMDEEGHGTAVAGIIAGSANGVAPAATIVAVRVLDRQGEGTSDQIIAGLNAVLASVTGGNPYNVKVANLSFGGYDPDAWPPNAGVCDELSTDFAAAFAALGNAGVLVVVASGNGGCATGVAWPACISGAIAVGAVYDANIGGSSYSNLECVSSGCTDLSTNADMISCYSDSGDKLAVLAPGHCATTPRKGGGLESCFGGTSASCAYASGAAALLSQAVPGRPTDALRSALTDTGRPLTDSRNNITRKRIDAAAALAELQSACTAPAAPAGVSVDSAAVCAAQQYTVTWGAVAGALSYTVQVSTDADFTNPQETSAAGASFTQAPNLAAPAVLHIRVRANGSCSTVSAWSPAAQVSYTPVCGSTYSRTYFLSGIAHTPGVKPAYWVSDVAVLNPSAAAAELRLTFYGKTVPPAVTASLPGHQQLAWKDVLASLFAMSGEDVGMITVESSTAVGALARTYSRVTDACDGKQKSYGQSYEGIEASQALAGAQLGYLLNLRSDGGFRTNVEFVGVAEAAASVEVRFYDDTGVALGAPLTRSVPANQRVAVTAALAAGVASAFAEVRVTPASARVIGFASVIDGASTDPTTIEMLIVSQ